MRAVAVAVLSAAMLMADGAGVTAGDILVVVNRYRESSGARALTVDRRLTRAAQARADDMAEQGYFAHTSPDGKTAFDLLQEVRYVYGAAGENLAMGNRTAEEFQRLWERSAGHRANQVNRKYTQTGIGVARVRSGFVVVQIFASPMRAE